MSPRPPPLLLKLLVPSLAAGAVIGKSGDDLALLQALTGAKVKISRAHDFYPGTTERICLIMGTVNAITQVHDYVMEKIYEKPEQITRVINEGKIISERHKQVKILVPNSTAGMIIGKSGCYIKEIKEKSGAFVQISQKSKEINLPERCVTIAGDIDQNKMAVLMILGKIEEDPHSSSCPGISYADILGPVASAYPTGSPYAMISTSTFPSPPSLMTPSPSTCSSRSESLSGTFPRLVSNVTSTALVQEHSCPFSNDSPLEYIDDSLTSHQPLPPSNVIRNILRMSGFSHGGIHSISTAIETICHYGLVNFGHPKSPGVQSNITLYDSFPLYGSHNSEESTSTNPLDFLIGSYLKNSSSSFSAIRHPSFSILEVDQNVRTLKVSKEKLETLESKDGALLKDITSKTMTDIKTNTDDVASNECTFTLQIRGLDLDKILEAMGMIIYCPLES